MATGRTQYQGCASFQVSNTALQSVHLTLGIPRQSQAVFYALAFFQLDGFAVPAPAELTQTVRIHDDGIENFFKGHSKRIRRH